MPGDSSAITGNGNIVSRSRTYHIHFALLLLLLLLLLLRAPPPTPSTFAHQNYMCLFYDEVSPMHRVSLVFHEYMHVVQQAMCGDTSNGSELFLMWIWEGAAMVRSGCGVLYR